MVLNFQKKPLLQWTSLTFSSTSGPGGPLMMDVLFAPNTMIGVSSLRGSDGSLILLILIFFIEKQNKKNDEEYKIFGKICSEERNKIYDIIKRNQFDDGWDN